MLDPHQQILQINFVRGLQVEVPHIKKDIARLNATHFHILLVVMVLILHAEELL
jgi:hypothetical protein